MVSIVVGFCVFFQHGHHGFCDVICHNCDTLIAVIL